MPPENTSWLMIATTSSGMICSAERASADRARPTIAAATVVNAMSTNNSRLRLPITLPASTAPGPHPLPMIAMAVTIADCTTANAVNTTILASRYAEVDKPTACSRRKMARSPISARIVSAVPMKIAPTLSITRIWPGSLGASPPSSAVFGTPKPTSPGTDSDRMPMMNGSSIKNAK